MDATAASGSAGGPAGPGVGPGQLRPREQLGGTATLQLGGEEAVDRQGTFAIEPRIAEQDVVEPGLVSPPLEPADRVLLEDNLVGHDVGHDLPLDPFGERITLEQAADGQRDLRSRIVDRVRRVVLHGQVGPLVDAEADHMDMPPGVEVEVVNAQVCWVSPGRPAGSAAARARSRRSRGSSSLRIGKTTSFEATTPPESVPSTPPPHPAAAFPRPRAIPPVRPDRSCRSGSRLPSAISPSCTWAPRRLVSVSQADLSFATTCTAAHPAPRPPGACWAGAGGGDAARPTPTPIRKKAPTMPGRPR